METTRGEPLGMNSKELAISVIMGRCFHLCLPFRAKLLVFLNSSQPKLPQGGGDSLRSILKPFCQLDG